MARRTIRRIDQSGNATPIVDANVTAAVEPLVLILCRRLGQTEEQAYWTREAYISDTLDAEDRLLLLEEYKKMVAEEKFKAMQAAQPPSMTNGIVDVEAAHINPRDPSRIPQKFFKRE